MVKVTIRDLTEDEEALRNMPTSVGTFHRVTVKKPEEGDQDDPMLPAMLAIEAWLKAEGEKYSARDASPREGE